MASPSINLIEEFEGGVNLRKLNLSVRGSNPSKLLVFPAPTNSSFETLTDIS